MSFGPLVSRGTALRALGALGAVSALPIAAYGEEKITIGVPSDPSLNYGPHYMMTGGGFLKQEGFDGEVVSFEGSGTLVPQLSTKRVPIGWVAPDVLLQSHQPGRDVLPLKLFYNGSRVSPWEFVVPANSPIKTMADLRGKTIGVGSMNFGNIPITKAEFKKMGMELGRDYKLVPVGSGAAAFQAFKSGQVDALNLFDAAHALLEVAGTGTKIRRLQQPPEFTNVTAHGFVAHDDTIKANSKLPVAIGRAFAKATIACAIAPQAAVRNFWRLYPQMKPSTGSEGAKLSEGVAVLHSAMQKYLAFPPGQRVYGSYTDQGLRNLVTALYDGGQLSTDKIDVHTLYTDQYIRDINAFDKNAVAAAVRKMR